MSIAKEEVRKLLDRLDDGASLEDIEYHLYVLRKIERGLADVDAGRVVEHEEVRKRMQQWTDVSDGPR